MHVDPFLAAALAYGLGFVSGAAILLIERRDKFVRFHAIQSVMASAAIALGLGVVIVLGLPRIPIVGFPIYLVSIPAVLVVWLILMVKAYQGDRFRLPLIGRLAARLSGDRQLAPPSPGS
jgi:uncharacterized membrane protein